MIITDQERDKLISEVKSPVIPLRGGIKLKKKLGYAWEEAKIDLKVVFEALIEEYVLESDEVLSKKALELKRKLLEYVVVKNEQTS